MEKESEIKKGLMGYLLPIVLPLAVIGGLEVRNKMLVGSIVRPWVAVWEDRMLDEIDERARAKKSSESDVQRGYYGE